MESFSSRLRSTFEELVEDLANFVRELSTHRLERSGPGVIIVAPEFWWDKLTAVQRQTQLETNRRYKEWFELLTLALTGATSDLSKELQRADRMFRKWLELGQNWSLGADPEANAARLKEDAQRLSELVAILEAAASELPILIPDTNAITASADPAKYRNVVNKDSFIFLLLPTVLGELDELKNSHRDQEFKKKVARAITRIKGWRNQGPLRQGVKVEKTITVRAVATEPDMDATLSWLDENNRDDRIIASVLSVQAEHPGAEVVLVTGDINMLNKADVAMVNATDPGNV